MRYNEELQRSWMRVASLSRKMLKRSRGRKRPRMETSEARAAGETSRPLSLYPGVGRLSNHRMRYNMRSSSHIG